MSNDLRVFRELILWLWQTHQRPWGYENESAQLIVETQELLNDSINTPEELEYYLPSEDKVCSSFRLNRYFYLTPVTESRIMVPRIQLESDFSRNIPEIRCRLELFLLDHDLNIKSLGFRLETPEGMNDQYIGIHHYYHIQLIEPPTLRVDCLPKTQPAFPLDADNPVGLILGLLLSLYGLDYLGKILKEAHNIWKLREYIDGIPHARFESFEWYRLVEVGDPR